MSHKRILVIDDEDDIREVTSMTLELVGSYEVTTAANGAEGIKCAYRNPPDAILLDVMMPVMDGPSTLAWLREHTSTKDIPVIFLTAKVQASDRRRFEALGVKGVIAKPFDPMKLSAEIEGILGWSESKESSLENGIGSTVGSLLVRVEELDASERQKEANEGSAGRSALKGVQ